MKKITVTLVVCIASATAAGVALALPTTAPVLVRPVETSTAIAPLTSSISIPSISIPSNATITAPTLASDGGPLNGGATGSHTGHQTGLATPPVTNPPATLSPPPTDPPPVSTAVGPATATMTVSNFEFSALNVAAGTVVTVTNLDTAPHSVTERTGLFDTGIIPPGGTATFIAPAAGTYEIYCVVHTSMVSSISVA